MILFLDRVILIDDKDNLLFILKFFIYFISIIFLSHLKFTFLSIKLLTVSLLYYFNVINL